MHNILIMTNACGVLGAFFYFQKVSILVFQNLSAYDITPVLLFPLCCLRERESSQRELTFSLEFN